MQYVVPTPPVDSRLLRSWVAFEEDPPVLLPSPDSFDAPLWIENVISAVGTLDGIDIVGSI